jgi:hypothetical protein
MIARWGLYSKRQIYNAIKLKKAYLFLNFVNKVLWDFSGTFAKIVEDFRHMLVYFWVLSRLILL